MKSRIDYLDGLRGVAILLVLAFHAYSRWPNLVPYGDTYANFPIFKLGWLGVQLFFLISGFVIFMTLDKTTNIGSFIFKRWLRLFPAMLLVSVLIFFTAPILDARPAGPPNALSLLPGLTFIEPTWWNKLLHIEIKPLEGAFWSLYVEFKFYIFASLIYYFLGRIYLAPLLFLLFVSSIVISWLSGKSDSSIIFIFNKISFLFSLKYFGWFASGSMFYLFHHSKKKVWFWSALGVAITSSIFVDNFNIYSSIAALIISILFSMALVFVPIQRFLKNKIP